MFTTEDKQDDRSRRFVASILEVLSWEAEGLYRRSDTKDYTCMVAAIGEVTLLGAATPHLDVLLRVMDTGDQPNEVFQSWEGQAAFSVWHTRENIGVGGDVDTKEPLADRVSRARAAVRLAAARGLDMQRCAVSWFGSSIYRGVLVRGARGDAEVLLPWADAVRLAAARGLDMQRCAVSWFGSSIYRGVLVRGARGDAEVLLPWADVEAERLAVSRGG